jgi:acyl-CoA synthetase (AMP-forming)/AMP-acid ligase II
MKGYGGHDKEPATRSSATGGCIRDRKRDMVNTGGFKVFPAEVERAIGVDSPP